MNKYGARKTAALTGEKFDSQAECQRWYILKLMERAGKISNLQRQVKFVLIPTQRDEKGKLLEKECSYVADFVYFDCRLGQKVVEDVKGFRTDTYKLKKKMMLWIHGIRITET